MNKWMTIAALLLGTAARADASGEQADYSMGAGISFFSTTFETLGLSSFQVASAPTARLSIERLVSPSTALVLGISGALSDRSASAPVANSGIVATSSQALAASAGVRHELTGRDAPVAVSFLALASFGYARSTTNYHPGGQPGTPSGTYQAREGAIGLGAGLTVERALTDRLGLRFSTIVLAGRYLNGRLQQGSPENEQTYSGFDLSLGIEPALELRVAF